MKELSLREIQLAEFGVLQKLDALCRQLELRYYLFYGTLLGAVRHQGFIPWDDDVDVAMPRPDYEKLLDYCDQNAETLAPFRLMHCRKDKEYIYPIARLCDTRYTVDYEGTVDYGLGLFVDLYPLDGCGDTEAEARKIHKKNDTLQRLTHLAGTDKFHPSLKGGIHRTVIKFLSYCYAKPLGARHFALKAEKNSMALPFDESKYVSCTVWFDWFHCFDKAILAEPTYLTFEEGQYSVPAGWDGLLKDWYGDYMQLPPEEQRVGHHYYKAYLKEGYEGVSNNDKTGI